MLFRNGFQISHSLDFGLISPHVDLEKCNPLDFRDSAVAGRGPFDTELRKE